MSPSHVRSKGPPLLQARPTPPINQSTKPAPRPAGVSSQILPGKGQRRLKRAAANTVVVDVKKAKLAVKERLSEGRVVGRMLEVPVQKKERKGTNVVVPGELLECLLTVKQVTLNFKVEMA